MNYAPRRLDALREVLEQKKADGIIVSNPHNVRYLSGYTGDDSALLITRNDGYFYTDFRYIEQATHEVCGLKLVQRKKSLFAAVAKTVAKRGMKRVLFESAAVTFRQYQELTQAIPRSRLVPHWGAVAQMRMVKDEDEIRAIRAAAHVAQKSFQRFRTFIKPGRDERTMANHLDFQMRALGASGPAFEIIVAARERASQPHARPTDRVLRRGEPLLVDWGARKDSYNCDLTRVLFTDRIPPRIRRVYEIVLEAQRLAIASVAPGVPAKQVDRAARQYIQKHGFGKQFGHGVGHGVGLEVHELPTLNASSRNVLKPGMVFTVEPGIYLPGMGGVRIEDMVLVTENGCEVLTSSPKVIDQVVLRG